MRDAKQINAGGADDAIPGIVAQIRAAVACQQTEVERLEKQRAEVRRYAQRTEAARGKRVKKKPARRA
jgi:hypothetical protein